MIAITRIPHSLLPETALRYPELLLATKPLVAAITVMLFLLHFCECSYYQRTGNYAIKDEIMSEVNRRKGLEQAKDQRVQKQTRRGLKRKVSLEHNLDHQHLKRQKTVVSTFDAGPSLTRGTPSASPKAKSVLVQPSSIAEGGSLTNAFTYHPLEEYLKAEALRLLFLRHGICHKLPRTDIQLLSEENLAPYIKRWEDCLDHWHPLMGPNALPKTKSIDDRVLRQTSWPGLAGTSPFFGLSQLHLPREGDYVPPIESPQRKVFPGKLDLNQAKPPLIPTIAQWAVTTSPSDVVRQLVASEVRKQLSDLEAYSNSSEEATLDDRLLAYVENNKAATSTDLQSSQPEGKRSEPKQLLSPRYLDDLTEVPQMVSVRRLTDGTLEYMDDMNSVS